MIIKKRSEITPKKEAEKEKPAEKVGKIKVEQEKIDLFDLDSINFSQRQERRRGDRRRGYRRIDDRNLISRAQEEAGTIRDNAAKEGYKAGIEKAQADIENMRNSLTSFLSAKQEVFEYIAPDILEISIDIAKKIVKHEIQQSPELILDKILDILKTLSRDETKVSIKVNPSEAGVVKGSVPELVSSLGLDTRVSVIADENIEAGSCILLTNNGIVDATVETQLEIIKEAFKGI